MLLRIRFAGPRCDISLFCRSFRLKSGVLWLESYSRGIIGLVHTQYVYAEFFALLPLAFETQHSFVSPRTIRVCRCSLADYLHLNRNVFFVGIPM